MALPKWILGCAVWKLHICRYNFQSLGNLNCISTHILIERSPRVFSCFFCFIRLPLWKEVYFMATYEWGYRSLSHLWTHSTFDSKEEGSKFGIIKSGTLNFCSPSTVGPRAGHTFLVLLLCHQTIEEVGLKWSPRFLPLQNSLSKFPSNTVRSRSKMIGVFH